MRKSFVAVSIALGLATAAPAEEGFVKLFPADCVPKRWVVTEWGDVGKKAPEGVTWEVKDGVLTAGKKRGTWLVSEKEYADFVLEFEIKLTERGNSGVALRSPMEAKTGVSLAYPTRLFWRPVRAL